jgi:hypothetical protein
MRLSVLTLGDAAATGDCIDGPHKGMLRGDTWPWRRHRNERARPKSWPGREPRQPKPGELRLSSPAPPIGRRCRLNAGLTTNRTAGKRRSSSAGTCPRRTGLSSRAHRRSPGPRRNGKRWDDEHRSTPSSPSRQEDPVPPIAPVERNRVALHQIHRAQSIAMGRRNWDVKPKVLSC